MKTSLSLFISASIVSMFIFQLAFTDAAPLTNGEAILDNSASDEHDTSVRSKKDADVSGIQQLVPSPYRRHHLKFGVLGKRFSYGYLGKRADVPLDESDFEDWLSDMRERRAGRPQYGMLG